MSSIVRHTSARSSAHLMIAGTNTSAGKNFLMCGLLRSAVNAGVAIKPFKPLELDLADGTEMILSPGMHQKAWSARVTLAGSMCPFWVVYDNGVSKLKLCGEHKGCVAHDTADLDSAFVEETVAKAIKELSSDGSCLMIEAPGAISESYGCRQVEATLDILDPDIVLVGDFVRGGGLASLIGTLELLPTEIRRRIIGIVLNHLDEKHGTEYPQLCSKTLEERFGIPIVGMLPTYRDGYEMVSEQNRVMPDGKFELQVDRLAREFESRLHASLLMYAAKA